MKTISFVLMFLVFAVAAFSGCSAEPVTTTQTQNHFMPDVCYQKITHEQESLAMSEGMTPYSDCIPQGLLKEVIDNE